MNPCVTCKRPEHDCVDCESNVPEDPPTIVGFTVKCCICGVLISLSGSFDGALEYFAPSRYFMCMDCYVKANHHSEA